MGPWWSGLPAPVKRALANPGLGTAAGAGPLSFGTAPTVEDNEDPAEADGAAPARGACCWLESSAGAEDLWMRGRANGKALRASKGSLAESSARAFSADSRSPPEVCRVSSGSFRLSDTVTEPVLETALAKALSAVSESAAAFGAANTLGGVDDCASLLTNKEGASPNGLKEANIPKPTVAPGSKRDSISST